MSLIENLNFIKVNGVKSFLEEQEKTWKCPKCGEMICCHNGICFKCGIERLFHEKAKYRWNDEKPNDA
jgi:ribosomal protein L32